MLRKKLAKDKVVGEDKYKGKSNRRMILLRVTTKKTTVPSTVPIYTAILLIYLMEQLLLLQK